MKHTSRHLFIAIALVMSFQTQLWAQSYSGGWGTADNPYVIATKADLKYLSEHASDWGKHFVQTADINLVASDFQGGGDFYNGGEGFIPIGDNSVYPYTGFTGTYDGNGHVIHGITINSWKGTRGLFGYVTGSIARLGVTGAYVAAGRGTIGALAGSVGAGGSVTRCYSTGYVVTTGYLVYGTVGGLVGHSQGSITESYSTCTVTSTQENSSFGGLVGAASGTIADSYARGNVGNASTSSVGGLVGRWDNLAVNRSYSTGAVNGTNTTTTHAFLGYSYNSGAPDTACFWNTETAGWGSGGGNSIGKTTAQMQTASTFTDAGWDFTNTWEIVGSNYPTLRALPADTLGPEVVSFTPADDDTLTNGAGTIVVLFDEIVVAQSSLSVRIYTSGDALVETIDADDPRITVSGRAVTIDPDSVLSNGAYYVQIDAGAFKDIAGNAYAGFSDNTTWNFIVEDLAPTVLSVSPADGGVVSHADTNLVVTFSETVVAQSGKNISLYRVGSGLAEEIPVTDGRVTVSGATVTINPDTLGVDGNYYVLIEAGAFKDLGGLTFAGLVSDTGWNFTMSDPAPTIASLTPLDGTTLTSSPGSISLSFSESVSAVSGKNITIYNVNDAVMEQIPANDGRISISGANVTIDPDTLLPNWDYYVQIESGAFMDAGQRVFAGISDMTTWNFTVNKSKIVTTDNATSISSSSAVLNASINPENDTLAVRFVWGSSSGSYTDTVAASPDTVLGSSTIGVTKTMTGLVGGASYFYKVIASNATQAIEGAEKSLSTPSAVWGSTLEFSSANSTYAKAPGVVTSATDDLTIEAWVKWNGTNTGAAQMIAANGYAGADGYGLYLYTDTKLAILVSAKAWLLTTATLTPGEWTHVAMVRSGGTYLLFKNGVSLTLGGDAPAAPFVPASNFFVGGDSVGNRYNGAIDEVRVSNVARYTSDFTPFSWPFDPDASTAALYHFNEFSGATASDASGDDHHLTLVNDPTWTGRSNSNEPVPATLTAGSALDFPGTSAASNYVEVANNPLLNPADNFTVELWARPEGGAGTYRCPLGSEDTQAGDEPQVGYYFYAAYDDTWHVWMGEGSDNWKVLFSSVPVTLNAWTHLALTFASDTARFYVNGILANTSVVDSFKVNTTTPFRIGEIGESPGYVQWNGKVDEVRVWHVARTERQIREAMHTTVSSTSTGLVAYFQLNEGSGTSVSGLINGITGTITGSPTWVTSGIPAGSGTSTSLSSFTTGTASLGTVSLTTTDAFDNEIDLTATEISGAPDSTTGIVGTMLGDRYWVVNSYGTPGTFAANMTFTVPASFTANGAGNTGLYTLYHRAGNGDGAWSAAVSGASALTATTVTFDGISSFSQFALGTEDPLPVQMAGMTAEVSGQRGEVRLTWKTVTEVDNAGWEVERREVRSETSEVRNSTASWVRLGFVEGAGTSTSPKTYAFSDHPPTSIDGRPALRFAYRLKQIDRSGAAHYSQEVEVAFEVPRVFALSQNYPNPFNPSTAIDYTLEADGHVSLKVYDLIGREVATLVNEEQMAGVAHQATFDASQLPTGMYLYRLTAGNRSSVRKLVLLK